MADYYLHDIAFNSAAPPDEKYDAQAELGHIYRPLLKSLMPQDELRSFVDHVRGQLDDADMLKANKILLPGRIGPPPDQGMQSVRLDDMQIIVQGDYFDKPCPIDFDGLREIVKQTPMLNSIVLRRIRQLGRFCTPSEDGGPGFQICHVDRTHKLTPDESEGCKRLTRFVSNCGWEFNPRKRKALRRSTFKQFMTMHYYDSLCMDSDPVETERKRNGKGMDGFYAVDGSTIRLCSEHGYDGDDEITALQVIHGRIVTAYTPEQLIYECRNPRADVTSAGYGMGEPELLVRVVTGLLNAMQYNISGFNQNSIPKGVMHLVGDYGTEDLAAFKRYFNMMTKGSGNPFALPVLVSKDQDSKASFEKFGVEFNEMYFAKWMTFLTSIACAIYGMDPAEINFDSFTDGKSALSGSDTKERLASAKDTGLASDMSHFESEITDYIIADFEPDFCFRFVSVDDDDAKAKSDRREKILTVDEQRAEDGYEKHADPDLGAAPLNPALISIYAQKMQAAQQAAQQASQPGNEFGGGGQGGPDYGDEQPDAGQGDDQQQGTDGNQQQQDGGAQIPPQAPDDGSQDAGGGDFGKALIFSVKRWFGRDK